MLLPSFTINPSRSKRHFVKLRLDHWNVCSFGHSSFFWRKCPSQLWQCRQIYHTMGEWPQDLPNFFKNHPTWPPKTCWLKLGGEEPTKKCFFVGWIGSQTRFFPTTNHYSRKICLKFLNQIQEIQEAGEPPKPAVQMVLVFFYLRPVEEDELCQGMEMSLKKKLGLNKNFMDMVLFWIYPPAQ